MNYKIALIRGDGIGPEVVGEAVQVMEAVGKKFGHSFTFEDILMGGCATDAVGVSYPEGTAEKCRACDAVLLGAVGGPKMCIRDRGRAGPGPGNRAVSQRRGSGQSPLYEQLWIPAPPWQGHWEG